MNTRTMSAYQNMNLGQWLAAGKQNGRIRSIETIIFAYCMDERDAVAWISDIVTGKISEAEALVFMERALQQLH
ncbi:MAG: hypothetical protein JW966_15650 [Anaerolineae bacterium]|nr:hypothetical protein [Anaerolineae bacterium]